jgi:hypothetical protein
MTTNLSGAENKTMVLVDTSVLVDFLAGRKNEQAAKLRAILDTDIPFGISRLIYSEVLQGAKNEKESQLLNDYLSTQTFYDLRDGKSSYKKAAMIYFNCKRRGVTLSGAATCVIAQTAIENNLHLLHHDRDFDRMAKIIPLKIF